MYLRIVQFTLTPDGRDHAQEMADDLASAIKEQAGCVGVTFFGGGEDGESGLCVLWDSQERADAAAVVISPKLGGHLQGRVKGEPSRRLFPVLAAWIDR